MAKLNLTDEFREARGLALYNMIMRDLQDRSARINRIAQVRAIYHDEAPPVQGPWPGASDIHIPVLAEKVEGILPKIINAFWGTDPLVNVKYPANLGRREAAKE